MERQRKTSYVLIKKDLPGFYTDGSKYTIKRSSKIFTPKFIYQNVHVIENIKKKLIF